MIDGRWAAFKRGVQKPKEEEIKNMICEACVYDLQPCPIHHACIERLTNGFCFLNVHTLKPANAKLSAKKCVQ